MSSVPLATRLLGDSAPWLGPIGVGLAVLVASVLLFFVYRFERFVAVRYLQRTSPSQAIRLGLYITMAGVAAGLIMLAAAHGRVRGLETVGVVFALVAALAMLLFVLLRVFSVFTTVSTMGVVLGVASLVVVLAVTSGFEHEFQDKVLAVNAHLIVTSYGLERDMAEAEQDAEVIKKRLGSLPGLERMSTFSFTAGEVMIGKVGANLKGVDLSDGAPELQRIMVAGSLADLGRPAHCAQAQPEPDPAAEPVGRIILGSELAHRLHSRVGECLQILVPFSGGIDSAPSAYTFRVVGISSLGFHEYDARLAFINLEDARRMGNARQSIFGVELRFTDPMQAVRIEPEVERRLGPEARVIDWKTLNRNLFAALSMQKLVIAVLLFFIIVVAAFNIIASLMLIVLSKVREIAILASMGARAATLLRVFLAAGTFVGFAGTGLGILYGLAICGLAGLYGYPLDPKVYLIARLPVQISVREILLVAASTQLICFVATLYPAVRAARLRVVDGLRYL
ncbi:MAG: ABC transporter permease [Polyangia bacterium]